MLLPAFDPVITPKDEEWEDLQMTFSYTFKNAPYEYHNGGLWPLVTGIYAAGLAARGKTELARRYCEGIHGANRLKMNGREWSFPEYVHGEKHTPGGTSPMGWSAAGAILAEEYARGKRLFE
jgi:glycogen debranching enzyme